MVTLSSGVVDPFERGYPSGVFRGDESFLPVA